jgi:hypothetical protein
MCEFVDKLFKFNKMSDFDIDNIIDRLLEVRGSKPGKPV